jgi:ADP-ribosylglycohydrolase
LLNLAPHFYIFMLCFEDRKYLGNNMTTHEERLARARISLDGLSVADALGGFLEGSNRAKTSVIVVNRQPPRGEWHYTDDTTMALSIYENLRLYRKIEQDELAISYAKHYNPTRGYGPGIRRLVSRISDGQDWREVAPAMYNGGSYGNGGAMRVAPLGAYFSDDINAVIENAKLSAEITHAHPEGIAGAIAVAVAASIALNIQGKDKPTRSEFIEQILPHVPDSEVKSGIKRAQEIRSTEIPHVVGMIGNGSRISAQDTVPFVLYCAGQWLDNYEEAIWQTMSGGGDVDTTCAMVGGIVACYVGQEGIPPKWLEHREKLPQWALEDV